MATLTTSHELGTSTLVLDRFANLVGPNKLSDRLVRVRKKLKDRVFLSDAAKDRYAIPLGFQKLYGRRVSSLRALPIAMILICIWRYPSPR